MVFWPALDAAHEAFFGDVRRAGAEDPDGQSFAALFERAIDEGRSLPRTDSARLRHALAQIDELAVLHREELQADARSH